MSLKILFNIAFPPCSYIPPSGISTSFKLKLLISSSVSLHFILHISYLFLCSAFCVVSSGIFNNSSIFSSSASTQLFNLLTFNSIVFHCLKCLHAPFFKSGCSFSPQNIQFLKWELYSFLYPLNILNIPKWECSWSFIPWSWSFCPWLSCFHTLYADLR